MIQLRYKPTGNIFTFNKEEAIKIYKTDTANYELIDCELPKEEVKKEKTIQELVMPEEITDEEKEEKQKENKITLEDLKQPELVGLAQKFGLAPKRNMSKATLIELLKTTGRFD